VAHEIQNPLNFVNNFSELNTELIIDLQNEARQGNLAQVQNIAEMLRGMKKRSINMVKKQMPLSSNASAQPGKQTV
jgi:hypothetical protein